jgi:hypothetical protein
MSVLGIIINNILARVSEAVANHISGISGGF